MKVFVIEPISNNMSTATAPFVAGPPWATTTGAVLPAVEATTATVRPRAIRSASDRTFRSCSSMANKAYAREPEGHSPPHLTVCPTDAPDVPLRDADDADAVARQQLAHATWVRLPAAGAGPMEQDHTCSPLVAARLSR